MQPHETAKTRAQVRLLQLLDAAEIAGITPLDLTKLHAFAYLADILSPVWGLKPFQARLAKTGRAPYFPGLQNELDTLVAMGLVEVSELDYRPPPGRTRPRLYAKFALRFGSSHLGQILSALEADADMQTMRDHLHSLANALATLPQIELESAASEDATYSDPALGPQDFIDFQVTTQHSRTQNALTALERVFPETLLPPARRVVMYAQYLGQRARARA